MIKKILSGGQTGVDRAALDAAKKYQIPHDGWCPKGRKAEDGVIPNCYLLKETVSDNYEERTKLNIRDSDGTLILVLELPIKVSNGTLLTIQESHQTKKPLLIISLMQKQPQDSVCHWLNEHHIQILNIAGPRESQSPGIYQRTFKFLDDLLPICQQQ